MFQLEGQQDFINFARVALFGGKVDIAGDLHGDGGGALAFGAAHIGQAGTDDADVVNAPVREETGVLDRQHGVFHHLGNVLDRGEPAALFPELANHHAVFRENPQRKFGPIVRQVRYIRKIRVGDGQRHRQKKNPGNQARKRDAHAPQKDSGKPALPRKRLCLAGA